MTMCNELFRYNNRVPQAVTACIHYIAVATDVLQKTQLHEHRITIAEEAIRLAKLSFDELKTNDEKFYCDALTASLVSADFEITQAKVDDRDSENLQ